ncbi:prohibitin family protein [Daejeonella sp.]|jgi:regulator of protease activity HflC (stomatin/prohibitin superfamily)|uniref:prohibitin family protein n=1 Tax=Daejeonella sp. TaxID=2805397 RepID=UPI00378306CD
MNKSLKKQKITSYLRSISIGVLLVLFVFVLFSSKIFIKIKSGEIGVLFDLIDGTHPETYKEGLNIISPLNEMFIYDLRTQNIEIEQQVLSHDGLSIRVKSNVLFRPLRNQIFDLHQKLGPNYPNTFVIPASQSLIRKLIADLTPEEIFLMDKGIMENVLISKFKRELASKYIDMEHFYISSIQLPDTISHAIEAKFRDEELIYQYDFKLIIEEKERKRKIIEAEGIKQFQLISNISPLQWKALDVTEKISKSPNSKIIMMGNSSKDLPILLNNDTKK